MKRVLLAGVALAALMGSASAADIPRRMVERPVAAPVPHVMAYNWTGFYAGLNAGWGWGTGSLSGPPPTGDMEGNGGLIGGTLGYNWQMNQVVFGVETDIAWSGIETDHRCRGGLRCEVNNDWLGTARGRIGVAMDRFMPFIAGGLAYGDVDTKVRGFPGTSDVQAGWTLGAGVEFALAAPWTARLEYLYVDLGDVGCGRRCGPGTGNLDFNAHIVRAGVNYRF
jgi:outer membrane immunogenic protein